MIYNWIGYPLTKLSSNKQNHYKRKRRIRFTLTTAIKLKKMVIENIIYIVLNGKQMIY